ncbi:hypothetical protein GGR57DRAFT_506015 [Xylariaceae sp. FL1272]|nr:hypothetical protein GGR57DRAFT_506015 [Xylariaceae sp. FL1272]
MPSLSPRYDEAAAKAEYVQKLKQLAATQDLSQDIRSSTRNLSIGFTAFAAAFVALRFLARWKQTVRFGADDWLMVVSLVLLFGNLVMNFELVKMGVGLHNGALPLSQLTMVGAEILYVTAVNMYKISLLFLYFRIFPVRSIRLGGYICGGISSAWNVACIFAASFQCSPREKIFMPWLQGTCINLFLTQLAISVPTIMCDIAILCLPMPHVWRLKTNLTQRIFLMAIFLLGSYVVFTSIYRFYVFLQYNHDDVPYTIAPGLAWNVIEISSGIVSACIPTLGPLVRTVFTSLNFSTRAGSKYPLGSSGKKLTNPHVVTIGSGAPNRSTNWKKLNSSRDDPEYEIFDRGSELDLVPEQKNGVTVTVSHNRNGHSNDSELSTDEYPLTAIHQHREVKWTEERVSI